MPRSQRNASFEKRSARFRTLAEGKEHWTPCDEGVHLGYRRGKTKSTWYLRRYLGAGRYEQRPIGLADDYQEADGDDVLTYYQAQTRAKARASTALKEGRPLPRRRRYTVADAVEAYLEHYRATSDKQTAELERVLNRDVIPKLGNRPVDDLTRRELILWRDGLIRAAPRSRNGNTLEQALPEAEQKRRRKATAQRKWTCLRAALNKAFVDGEAASDVAWRTIEPLRGLDTPPPTRILTAKECRQVTNALPDDFRPLGQATYLTGAAFKELREAVVDDYMAETGHLRVFNTKRRPRLVPLTDEGRQLFDALTAGKPGTELIFTDAGGAPWGKSTQSRRMREASKAAKIAPPITLTELRTAYGSMLLNAGVSIDRVAKAMGHRSIDTTRKHYAHLLQGEFDKAIRDALPKLGIEATKVARLK